MTTLRGIFFGILTMALGAPAAMAAGLEGIYKVTKHVAEIKPCGSAGAAKPAGKIVQFKLDGDELSVLDCESPTKCDTSAGSQRRFKKDAKGVWMTYGSTAISNGKVAGTCALSAQRITLEISGKSVTLADKVLGGETALKGKCTGRDDYEKDVLDNVAKLKCEWEETIVFTKQ